MRSSSATLAALVFGLGSIAAAVPAPAPAPVDKPATNGGFVVTHKAADYFPHAAGDLSPWDISVHFTGYNSSMESWLNGLDPHSGASDEEKAQILLSAAYAKAFDHGDADMVNDKEALLGAVAGKTAKELAEHMAKRNSQFIVSHAHVVVWHTCAAFFSCVSGVSCSFNIEVGKAPRSKCQSQGGENCCISWSSYKVQAGFFSRTWTNCDQEVRDEHASSASCEGKGDNTGGDVCLSNRATGCT